MKLKGVNVFEQHVEKLVLGIAALAALGVVGAQFLLQPNKVKIGPGDAVAPEQAYKPVADAATELLAKVNATPKPPAVPKTDVLAKFERMLKGTVAPKHEMAAMGPVLVLGTVADDTSAGAGGPVAEVTVPAPRAVTARMVAGTVDPLEVVQHPELKAILPPQQPFDKFAVSVQVAFDGAAFKQALGVDPDGPGPVRAVPSGWVRDSLEVIGVEMERQKLGPGGEWGETTVVPPMPGRPDLLGDFRKQVKSVGDVPQLLDRARARAQDVQRPDYYTMIAGPGWVPPSEAADGLSLTERIDTTQKKLNRVEEDIDRLRKNQARQQRDASRPASGPPSGPPGGGGKGGAGGQSGERGREPPKPSGKPGESMIEKEIARKEADRERLTKELDELKNRQATGGKELAPTSDAARPSSLLESPNLRLWSHDVTVEPGATYQYRVRVVTNNPFFGREAGLLADQKSLAAQPLSAGEWSEWSDPVSVDRTSYYFVTSAAERSPTGSARASIELMQFYYGFFRRANIGVSPGDVLAGEAKLPPKLAVFDMDKLALGVRPSIPGAEEPAGGGGGGGKGAAPSPRGRPEPAATPAARPGEGPAGAAPEGLKFLPDKLPIALNAVLVDVGPAMGQGSGNARAFLSEAPGVLTVRGPEVAARGSLLERLQQSAKLGESQGQPQVKAREPKPETEITQPQYQPPPRGRDGGGGGGGGGG